MGGMPFFGKIMGQVLGWDYTHVGIHFDQDDHVYEANMRDGVSRQPLSAWTPSEAGQVLVIPVLSCDSSTVRNFLEEQVGKLFDWKAVVVDKVFNIANVEHPSWWFCSELIAEALRRGQCLESKTAASEFMPYDLYQSLNSSTQSSEKDMYPPNGHSATLEDNFETSLAENHRSSLKDNHATSLNDTGTTQTFVVGPVATAVGFTVAAIPVVAGFFFLKDRWGKKSRSKSKK